MNVDHYRTDAISIQVHCLVFWHFVGLGMTDYTARKSNTSNVFHSKRNCKQQIPSSQQPNKWFCTGSRRLFWWRTHYLVFGQIRAEAPTFLSNSNYYWNDRSFFIKSTGSQVHNRTLQVCEDNTVTAFFWENCVSLLELGHAFWSFQVCRGCDYFILATLSFLNISM